MPADREVLIAQHNAFLATSWGGASLGIGAMVTTIGIVLDVVAYGRPAATGQNGEITLADQAAHMLAHWELARGKFLIEMAGNLFMALGGFLLQQRRLPASRLPSAVAWLPVGMGATVVAAMYAFMIGSYRAAAAAYAHEPAVFTALQGGATMWFYAGVAVTLAGLTGAFVVEASTPERVIPRWTAILGVVVAGAAAIHVIALLTGAVGWVAVLGGITLVLAYGSVLLTYPLAALLGGAIWKRTRGAV
jgi:hypothetical protein